MTGMNSQVIPATDASARTLHLQHATISMILAMMDAYAQLIRATYNSLFVAIKKFQTVVQREQIAETNYHAPKMNVKRRRIHVTIQISPTAARSMQNATTKTHAQQTCTS